MCEFRLLLLRNPRLSRIQLIAAALGLCYAKRTSVEHRAIHPRNGSGRLLLTGHGYEREPPGSAAVAILNNLHFGQFAAPGKSCPELLFGRLVGQISDV